MKPGSIYTLPQYKELLIIGVATDVDTEYVKGNEIHCSRVRGELLTVQLATYRKRSEIVELVEEARDLELEQVPNVSIADMQQVVSLDELRALWPRPKAAAQEAEEEGLEA